MRKNGFVVMGHLLKLVTPLAHIIGVYHYYGYARFSCSHLYYGAGCDGVSESS